MKPIQWNPEYEVGDDRIDFQHQILVGLVNNLIQASNGEESYRQEVLRISLEQVLNYTKYHFETEEDLMKEAGYPDFSKHKKLHESLKAKTANLYDRICKMEKGLDIQVIEFLQTWLLEHIGHSDKAYMPYVHKIDRRNSA